MDHHDPGPFGRVSRRGVLQGATALGTAALLGPLGATGAAAAQPKPGGTLRLGLAHGSTTDTLDPGIFEQVFTQVHGQCRHNYLTEIAPDGELVAEMAESWEASPDAKQWTFKIREGVTFHSGKTLTADDVIASLNYHRGEESHLGREADRRGRHRDEGGRPERGRRHAQQRQRRLRDADGGLPHPDPAGHRRQDRPALHRRLRRLTCTRSTSRACAPSSPGTRTTGSDGGPTSTAIEILAIIDSAARQNAVVTGEVDVIDRVDLQTVALLQRAPGDPSARDLRHRALRLPDGHPRRRPSPTTTCARR